MAWRDWRPWALILALVGGFSAVANFAKALDGIPTWVIPATRAYVTDAVNPGLIVGLRNSLALVDVKEAAIRLRIEMAETRLRSVPSDAFAKVARDAANDEMRAAEWEKVEAECQLRQALGIGCGR